VIVDSKSFGKEQICIESNSLVVALYWVGAVLIQSKVSTGNPFLIMQHVPKVSTGNKICTNY